MGLTLADKKELESLLKLDKKSLKHIVNFADKNLPSQASFEDFTYGFTLGLILGNFFEKFSLQHNRDLDNDELLDVYFILSLKSPKIRKLLLDQFK
ncbi:MAG: hypothetical protein ACPKPY_03680 [Nitrososphaeraceae archaeon]